MASSGPERVRGELEEMRDRAAQVEETVHRGSGIAGNRIVEGRLIRLHAEPWEDDVPSGDPSDPRLPVVGGNAAG